MSSGSVAQSSRRPQATVDELIDRFGLGRYQVKMFFLCGLCWTADAMEIMMLEFLFREIKVEFNLGSGTDGLISGLVFIGMFFGAIFWGLFSDKFGRRLSYLITSLFVGVFGMLCAASTSLTMFLICRFLVGFGFGGSHTAYTLWQEFTPTESRGTLLLLNQLFWTLGALLEALMAWVLIPNHPDGWRHLMFVSAILPFVTASFFICLPESPRFLIVKGRQDEAAQALRDVARAHGHEYPEGTELVLETSDNSDRNSFLTLFHPALIFTTLGLVFVWASDTFTYYGGAFITPKFFNSTSLYTAALITTAAEVPGIFLPMLTLDTIGRKATLGLLLCLSSIFFFVLAFVPDQTVVLICLCVARMCSSSAFTVTYIYTSEVYPTLVRSTGLGVNSALARLAGFATSYVATGLDKTTGGIIYGSISVAAGLVSFILPYETRARPMFDNIDQLVAYDRDGPTGGDSSRKMLGVGGNDVDHRDDEEDDGALPEKSVTRLGSVLAASRNDDSDEESQSRLTAPGGAPGEPVQFGLPGQGTVARRSVGGGSRRSLLGSGSADSSNNL